MDQTIVSKNSFINENQTKQNFLTSRSFINMKKIKKKEKRSCSNNSKKYESSKLNSSF